MTKSPIDLMRESGGAFKIESDDDDTPIQEMCTLNDGLARYLFLCLIQQNI